MDLLEKLELSLCILVGFITFSSTVYSLCTLYPADVSELAKFVLPGGKRETASPSLNG